MFFFVTRSFGPASEHNDVGTTDVHRVVEPVLRWGPTDPQAAPYKSLSVENSDIVQISLLQLTANFILGFLDVFNFEVEATMDDQVCPNQDGAMPLSGAWRRPRSGWC